MTLGDTGLQYLRARVYSPADRRFLTYDGARTLNRYAYTDGNPVNRTDPTGRDWITSFFTQDLLPQIEGAVGQVVQLAELSYALIRAYEDKSRFHAAPDSGQAAGAAAPSPAPGGGAPMLGMTPHPGTVTPPNQSPDVTGALWKQIEATIVGDLLGYVLAAATDYVAFKFIQPAQKLARYAVALISPIPTVIAANEATSAVVYHHAIPLDSSYLVATLASAALGSMVSGAVTARLSGTLDDVSATVADARETVHQVNRRVDTATTRLLGDELPDGVQGPRTAGLIDTVERAANAATSTMHGLGTSVEGINATAAAMHSAPRRLVSGAWSGIRNTPGRVTSFFRGTPDTPTDTGAPQPGVAARGRAASAGGDQRWFWRRWRETATEWVEDNRFP